MLEAALSTWQFPPMTLGMKAPAKILGATRVAVGTLEGLGK